MTAGGDKRAACPKRTTRKKAKYLSVIEPRCVKIGFLVPSIVHQISALSLYTSASESVALMCLIMHYHYDCSTKHHEVVFQPCFICPYPLYSQTRRYRLRSLSPTNPFMRRCPKLWEKTIYPPTCIRCMTRGSPLKESERHWI